MSLVEWTRAAVAAAGAGAEQPLIIIDNEVYAVRQWLQEHPGGPDVLLDNAGRDATQCFVRQGHSAEARALMGRFAVGPIAAGERWPELGARLPPATGASAPLSPTAPPPPPPPAPAGPVQQLQSLLSAAGPPLVLAVLAILLYSYLF